MLFVCNVFISQSRQRKPRLKDRGTGSVLWSYATVSVSRVRD